MPSKDSEKGSYSSPDGSKTWEYLSAIFCAIGMTCIGAMLGWNSTSLTELSGPDSRIPMTPGEASTLTASFSFGTIFYPPLSILVVDRIGRKNAILIATIPMVLSWGMIIVAEDVIVLIIARIMAGISLGLVCATVPIYMVEILSANTRGSLGAMGGVTCYGGILFMFAAAPALGVKITAGIFLGFSMIFLICFWCIPESPYFLVMVGRIEEAEISLEKLRGKTDVTDEMEMIKSTIRDKRKIRVPVKFNANAVKENQSALKLLFKVPENLRALFIAFLLTTTQHFCGFHTILNYCHIIIRDMGSDIDLYYSTLTFSILQILSIFIYALVVDKFGRRTLMLGSGTITVFLLTIIATYFYLLEHTSIDVKRFSLIPLGSILSLVLALNLGVITLPTMIMAEIFATDVKVLGGCVAATVGTLEGMISVKFYLLIATSWGFGHSVPFFCYAIITLLCMVLIARILPETKGKTLAEIQQDFSNCDKKINEIQNE